MTLCKTIYDFLNSFAPDDTQDSFDNSGFLFGDISKAVNSAILALDVTSEVIEEAEDKHAQLIITHHPLIFGTLKNVYPDNPTGKKIISLSQKGICVISMHTNLDKATGGVNDILLQLLGGDNPECLAENPYIRIGTLNEKTEFHDYLNLVKKSLRTNGLRYYDAGRKVYRIACTGGSGGEGIADAYRSGCDTFVTADIKYSVFLEAKEYGINLIDADHYCTENPVILKLCSMLRSKFPETEFILSEQSRQTAQFF